MSKYTVFVRNVVDGSIGWCPSGYAGMPDDLDGLIRGISHYSTLSPMTAWVAGELPVDAPAEYGEALEAKAIAAGRLIEFKDGKYIPLGVSPTPTLDKMEAEKGEWVICEPNRICSDALNGRDCGCARAARENERKREPLDWNKPQPFDNFKGWEPVKSHTKDQQASQNHALQRCADFDGLVMKVR